MWIRGRQYSGRIVRITNLRFVVRATNARVVKDAMSRDILDGLAKGKIGIASSTYAIVEIPPIEVEQVAEPRSWNSHRRPIDSTADSCETLARPPTTTRSDDGRLRRRPATTAARSHASGRGGNAPRCELRRRQIRHNGLSELLLSRSKRVGDWLSLLHDRPDFFWRFTSLTGGTCGLAEGSETVQLRGVGFDKRIAERPNLGILVVGERVGGHRTSAAWWASAGGSASPSALRACHRGGDEREMRRHDENLRTH